MTMRDVVDTRRYDVLLPVLNKMQAQALCRFRQTNRQMDKFVERIRHEITAFHNVTTWIRDHFICDRYHTLVMGVSEIDDHRVRSDIYDPYKQLSAINFRKIGVGFNQEDGQLKDGMLAATLKKMRLKCETLRIVHAFNALDDYLTLILATKKVSVFEGIVLADLSKWPIKHLKCEFRLKELDRLSVHLKDCVDIHLEPIEKLTQEKVANWVKEFLGEIRENRNARGTLEHLVITYGKVSLVQRFPGIRELCRGYIIIRSPYDPYEICSEIQKLEIDGGFLLFIRRSIPFTNPDDTHIFFLESDSRLNLFNAFSSYNQRHYEQLDLSDKKDAFLNAKDDGTAFALLFPKHDLGENI